MIPPTPTPSKKDAPKPGRHRVKKQVKKTFVDEEGFMVTKAVMESCSETDEEPECAKTVEPKKELSESKNKNPALNKAGSSSKLKNDATQNNKQSSIMSFFQKK